MRFRLTALVCKKPFSYSFLHDNCYVCRAIGRFNISLSIFYKLCLTQLVRSVAQLFTVNDIEQEYIQSRCYDLRSFGWFPSDEALYLWDKTSINTV